MHGMRGSVQRADGQSCMATKRAIDAHRTNLRVQAHLLLRELCIEHDPAVASLERRYLTHVRQN